MAEELQGLLDRIQKDGIEKANTEASAIIDDAKAQAKNIANEAEEKAEALLKNAREEGELFQQRGESAVANAARDVILSVGDAVTATLKGLVSARVEKTLSDDALADLIKQIVLAYCEKQSPSGIAVLVNDKQREQINAFFLSEMADQMKNGLTIHGDRNIVSGFKVSLENDAVYHDFTGATLTDSLCSLLRPQLAEIVKKAMPENANANS